MLSLNETIVQMGMANSVHWYGPVLRREDGHVLRRALDFEEERETIEDMERQAEEEMVKAGLRREDALCQPKWSVGVNNIAAGLR